MPIIDEKRDAIDCIENKKLIGKSPRKTCRLIGKYYFSIGKNKNQVLNDLKEFLKVSYDKYNDVKWHDELEIITNQLSKHKHEMIYVDKISFTDKELSKIDTLPSEPLKRLSFAILYKAKLTQAEYKKDEVWLSDSISYFARIGRVYGSRKDRMLMLSKLNDFGFIKPTHGTKNFCFRVDFIEDGEDVIVFKDIQGQDDQVIYHYKKWKGKNIIECKECGRLIELKSNKSTYCISCAKLIKNAQDAERMRKNRLVRK